MISIIDSGKLVNTDVSPMVPRSCEMVGLSTDTKPTGVSVGNGWSFIEMDTGKVFFYNAEDEEWLEFAGTGGGGGQGGSNVLIVGMDMATHTLDKTWTEIKNADYPVVVIEADENTKQWMNILSAEYENGLYTVHVTIDGSAVVFATSSANGYPVLDSGD